MPSAPAARCRRADSPSTPTVSSAPIGSSPRARPHQVARTRAMPTTRSAEAAYTLGVMPPRGCRPRRVRPRSVPAPAGPPSRAGGPMAVDPAGPAGRASRPGGSTYRPTGSGVARKAACCSRSRVGGRRRSHRREARTRDAGWGAAPDWTGRLAGQGGPGGAPWQPLVVGDPSLPGLSRLGERGRRTRVAERGHRRCGERSAVGGVTGSGLHAGAGRSRSTRSPRSPSGSDAKRGHRPKSGEPGDGGYHDDRDPDLPRPPADDVAEQVVDGADSRPSAGTSSQPAR